MAKENKGPSRFFSRVRKRALKPVSDFIDSQVTKQLKAFLEIGTDVMGEKCSDFVVDGAGDMSVENMFVQTSVANEALSKKGLPFRVAMVCADRIAIDIPWENLISGDWKLEVLGLTVLIYPLEREGWMYESLRKAKEASIEGALAELIKKIKALDQKKKKPSFIESIVRRLIDQVKLTVTIRDIHIRIEREDGMRMGAPMFCAGMVLPSMSVATTNATTGLATEVNMGKAGVYVHHGGRSGVCISAAAKVVGEAGALALGHKRIISSPSDVEKKAEAAAEQERQQAFFTDQNAMRDAMKQVAKAASHWEDSQWFFLFRPADDETHCLSAAVKMDSSHKDDPSKFDYERPFQITSCHMGQLSLQATEMQLASLMSLTTHLSEYKLWASYQIMRQLMQLPQSGSIAPKRRWRAASRAVAYSLNKAKVKTANVAEIIRTAKAYKKSYLEFLQSSGLSEKALRSAVKRLNARAALSEIGQVQLQMFEDLLPVDTLAWCRFVAQNAAIAAAKRKGNFARPSSAGSPSSGDDDGDGVEDLIDETDDISRMQELDASVLADPRLSEGPDHYVCRAVDVQIDGFTMQLLRSLDATEQVQQGLGYTAYTGGRGVELMVLNVAGVHARMRVVKAVGATTNVVVTSIIARAGPAGNGGNPTAPPKPLILRFEDSMYGVAVSDSMLGGPIESPGAIDAFLALRRDQLRGLFGRARNFAHRTLTSSEGDSTSASKDDANCDRVPAIRAFTMKSSRVDIADEMDIQMGKVFVEYSPPFWVALEAFLRPVERVKWASQLGATERLRKKHGKMYLACDKLMKEEWHTAQIKIMTPFLELSNFLGLPSARHKMNVEMKGFEFKLLSDKDDSTEELMKVDIPPMAITKSPRVGHPLPPVQKMQIKLLAPVGVESAMQTGAFARVLNINLNGAGPYNGFTRLGGTRDALNASVRALHAEIGALEAEQERLMIKRNLLRSASMSSALAMIEVQAITVCPGYGTPLHVSPAMDGSVMPSAAAKADAEAENATAATNKLQQSVDRIEGRMGEVVAYVQGKERSRVPAADHKAGCPFSLSGLARLARSLARPRSTTTTTVVIEPVVKPA